jgi:hypothetical protein
MSLKLERDISSKKVTPAASSSTSVNTPCETKTSALKVRPSRETNGTRLRVGLSRAPNRRKRAGLRSRARLSEIVNLVCMN